jgi:hypothetical protein
LVSSHSTAATILEFAEFTDSKTFDIHLYLFFNYLATIRNQ